MKNIAVAILAGTLCTLTVPAQVPGAEGTNSTTERNLPPGLQNQSELPPGLARRTNDTGVASSQSDTNTQSQIGSTSGTGSTNAVSGTTRQDSALTQGDQRILALINRTVKTQITSTPTSAGASAVPVHFIVQNGVVQISGTVPTAQEKQRIETTVERIPGVIAVVDRIQVTTPGGSASNAGTNVSGASGTNTLFPTSQTNRESSQYSNTNQPGGTNLPPTSRTNTPGPTLPPGLENRDELPPGLQNRDQLPPGLERRTNSSTTGGS